MTKPLLAMLSIVLCLSGCGGGGGGTIAPTSNVMRQLQPGDWALYDIVGTNDYTEGIHYTTTSTLRVSVFADTTPTHFGGRALRMVYAYSGTTVIAGPGGEGGNDGYVTLTNYVEQAPDGTLYTLGADIDVMPPQTEPQIMRQGSYVVGEEFAYLIGHSIEPSTAWKMQVMPAEVVSGQMAYKIHHATVDLEINDSWDEWFVPDWGFPIKQVTTMTDPGQHSTRVQTLRAKHLQ